MTQDIGDNDALLEPYEIKSEVLDDEPTIIEQKFKCRICKTSKMMPLEDFKKHYKSLHKDKRLPRAARTPLVMHSCDVCSKNFKSLRNLNEHMDTHNNQYDCEECNESFKKILPYTLHKRVHSMDDLFRCIFCDFSTEHVSDITSHLNMKHETNHRYICKICNKGFDVLTWFKEHDNFHSGVKPFKCGYCGKSFLYSRYLSAHKNSMHKEEMTGISSIHECGICKKQYQHKNSLKLHMNVHTGNFSICDICGKQLSSKEKLKFHLRIHTGYKPFKCSYCEKCFTKKPILVEHERIHTGERPYDCEYCHKAFSQRSSLVIHIRSHTGEKPYVCHVCNKGFVARAMLNIHFKTCKGY